jgi:hypothetical protein
MAGATEYFGDLTPARRDYFKEATPHGGIMLRCYLGTSFSLRGNLYAAKLAGNDAWYTDPEWRQHRNFSFTTELYELSAMLEYDLLRRYRLEHGGKFGIYVMLGIGACYTNPQRNFNNVDAAYFGDADAAVWGTNADFYRNPQHVALVMPVGGGLRYDIAPKSALFVEGGVRQGFDDKIDGFTESTSSGKNDAYAFASLGLTIRLGKKED